MRSSWRAWLLGATMVTGSGCIEPLPSPRPPVMVRSFSGTLIPGDYVSPTAYEHYMLAELHSQHGRPEDAVDELRRAIASDGASAYLRTRLCEELLTIGRIDEAREEVEAALALDSEFAEAHVDRARVLMRLGDRSGAEVSLRRAIDIDPRCQDAYVTLVGLYRLSRGAGGGGGDSAKVEATWRALARAVPSSARAHQALGHLLVERGVEPEVERAHHAANRVLPIPVESEAERELRRALQLDPSSVDAQLDLAQLARLEGHPDEAARIYAEVYQRNHDLSEAESEAVMLVQAGQRQQAADLCQQLEEEGGDARRMVAVGRLWLVAGQPERALALAQRAIAQRELPSARLLGGEAAALLARNDDALAMFARVPPDAVELTAAVQRAVAILCNDGRFADARELVARALKTTRYASFIDENAGLSPRFSVFDDLQVIAADLELRAGEPQRAVAVLEKAMHTRPSSSILPLALARALLAAGQRDRAAEVAHALIHRDEQQIDALLFLGALEEERGKMDEAARLLERARVLAPRSPQVADAVGNWALQRGRLDDAEPLLVRAERLSPDDPHILAHLAELRVKRSQREAALQLYRRALALHPAEPLLHEVEQQVGQLESDRVGAR